MASSRKRWSCTGMRSDPEWPRAHLAFPTDPGMSTRRVRGCAAPGSTGILARARIPDGEALSPWHGRTRRQSGLKAVLRVGRAGWKPTLKGEARRKPGSSLSMTIL